MSQEDVQTIQAWTGIFITVFTAGSLVALVFYVFKTWQIASATSQAARATELSAKATERAALASEKAIVEMQLTRQLEAAPQVVCYFDIPTASPLVYVVVENIGRSPARSVTIAFDPPLSIERLGHPSLPLPVFLTEPIPYLPPKQELRTLLWSSIEVFGSDSKVPRVYQAVVRYTGPGTSHPQEETYQLDVSVFLNRTYVSEASTDDMHKVLKEIAGKQSEIASALQGTERRLATTGLQISNGSLIIDMIRPQDARAQMDAKLREIGRVWDAWAGLDENQRALGVSELQRRLSLLRNQLQAFDPGEGSQSMLSATDLLGKLAQFRFYADGGHSLEEFWKLGEKMVSLLDSEVTEGG